MDQYANQNTNTVKKNNGLALTSFILGLVGLIIAGIPCGICAIIFGGVGIAKFKPDTQKNKWMAITGLILGIVDVVATILILPMVYSMLGIL